MEENTSIATKFKKDTFPWQSQLKEAKLKSSRNMRWHPLMIIGIALIEKVGSFQFALIRWSIYLRLLSGKRYEVLRESG